MVSEGFQTVFLYCLFAIFGWVAYLAIVGGPHNMTGLGVWIAIPCRVIVGPVARRLWKKI